MTDLDQVMIDYFDRLWPGLSKYSDDYKLRIINQDPILLRNSKILLALKRNTPNV